MFYSFCTIYEIAQKILYGIAEPLKSLKRNRSFTRSRNTAKNFRQKHFIFGSSKNTKIKTVKIESPPDYDAPQDLIRVDEPKRKTRKHRNEGC